MTSSLLLGYFTEFFLILNNGLTPLGGTEVDAHNLILANKTLIATEAVERMLLDPANLDSLFLVATKNVSMMLSCS